MNGHEINDGVAEMPGNLTSEDTDHAKMLMVNARIRLSADLLQDLAYDLAGLESAEVVAELIQMSVNLQRLLERRRPE
ncbi:MAG: hypothetical protein AAF641_03815 [Pseudomonadota bacterium]